MGDVCVVVAAEPSWLRVKGRGKGGMQRNAIVVLSKPLKVSNMNVKEAVEKWGRERGIIVTADQRIEELEAENEKQRIEIVFIKAQLSKFLSEPETFTTD